MTILVQQPQPDLGIQEKGIVSDVQKKVEDGGFIVPESNAFGNTDYSADTERKETVRGLYRQSHINQTYDFVKQMREKYRKMDRVEMSIWECCELLNEVVDDSDPDLDEPQIEHLLQTAEAIRKDYPNEDWLHLTALIHDLGKVLLLPSFGGLPQWAVVGDTFPLGCAFDESIVHPEFFKENPDYNNPLYNTKNGVYSEGCGLENVLMSWGHDDYMYLVAKENKSTLPNAGLFIVRYHSFYPLHKNGAYTHLMNDEDRENLKWLEIFNKYDLYSKSKVRINVEKVKPYYESLSKKRSSSGEIVERFEVISSLLQLAFPLSVFHFGALYVKGANTRERRNITGRVRVQGRRELLFSTLAAVELSDSRTELLNKFLKKSEENKEKNDKERLESYYKRNYKDYFGVIEGTLRQKVQNKEQLTESEQRILEWLDKNK
nr:inositol oxygenase 2-like [Ipomoea batatas]